MDLIIYLIIAVFVLTKVMKMSSQKDQTVDKDVDDEAHYMLSCVIDKVEHKSGNVFLATNTATQKFLGQGLSIDEVINLITEKFPKDTIMFWDGAQVGDDGMFPESAVIKLVNNVQKTGYIRQ